MKLAQEPRWLPKRHLNSTQIPEAYRCWLVDPASLTARLRQACNGCFRVQVLAQRVCRPAHNEAQALNMRFGARAVVREVQLLCDDTPWVFARTVIPLSTLKGPQRQLAHLGSRPLGAVLFADPTMRRSEVEIADIRAVHAIYHAAVQHLPARRRSQSIWGRRSVFHVGNKPLLVSEVFLPSILAAPCSPALR